MAKRQIMISGAVLIILCYLPIFLLDRGSLFPLTAEDGFYESLGALFFFIASVAFLFLFLKAKNKNIFFLLFSFTFLFAAGEEISWGQRIFNFDVPFVEANNAQKEFNFHNLDFIQHENGLGSSLKGMLFNFNRLFMLTWTMYCILIPLTNKYSDRLKNMFSRMRLPIVSLWFGALFVANEITSKTLEVVWLACQSDSCPKVSEIKEALWGAFVFLWAVYFFFGCDVAPLVEKPIGEQYS